MGPWAHLGRYELVMCGNIPRGPRRPQEVPELPFASVFFCYSYVTKCECECECEGLGYQLELENANANLEVRG